jgi:hypothetical protein
MQNYLLFRHLRFLIRSAEELIQTTPTLAGLKNETAIVKNEVRAIRTQLADVVREKDLDRATAAEEKDGRLNET